MIGYMLDAMDVLLYVFAMRAIQTEFALSNREAGLVSSATLIASSFGGIVAGMLCDRIGRRKTLILTILAYSLASGGTAFSTGLASLIFWRALVGLGLGGEWSAGATLVAESWPAQHRGKAIALMQSGWAIGYMIAALLSSMVLPEYGWRPLFLIGTLPALLTIFLRMGVTEPKIYLDQKAGKQGSLLDLFREPEMARRTIIATVLATSVLFGYWGLNTWLPNFLASPVEQGGAGLGLVKSSTWVIAMQAGAFAGYLTFGWMSDRFGRRPSFAGYVLMAGLLSFLYGTAPQWAGESAPTVLLLLGPFIGFFGTGFFSLFGSMLAELYPTRIRGTGQGFAYNFGRGVSSLAPFLVGAVADAQGLGIALAMNAGFFMLGAVIVFRLPETRNTELDHVT